MVSYIDVYELGFRRALCYTRKKLLYLQLRVLDNVCSHSYFILLWSILYFHTTWTVILYGTL